MKSGEGRIDFEPRGPHGRDRVTVSTVISRYSLEQRLLLGRVCTGTDPNRRTRFRYWLAYVEYLFHYDRAY